MAGQHNDLQKLAQDKGLSTVFLSCYAYKMNLVSLQSTQPIVARKVFLQKKNSSVFFIRMFEKGQCGAALPVKIFLLMFK
jgi:hypothetical protein